MNVRITVGGQTFAVTQRSSAAVRDLVLCYGDQSADLDGAVTATVEAR